MVRARERGEDTNHAKSLPGDLDLTIYSLKKFCRLVLGGNPSLRQILHTPTAAVIKDTDIGQALCSLAPDFMCKQTARRFLNYMRDQKERLPGRRGQKDVNRPESVDCTHG